MWELDYEEGWAPKNWCFWTVVLEKTLESLRVPWTARRSNQSILKEIILGVHWKDWCWSWNSNILATSYEELTHWKRLWCWERLGAGGEGYERGWDGWMASPTQWTWVWVDSRSWWWTGRPGVCDLWGRKGSDMNERLNLNKLNSIEGWDGEGRWRDVQVGMDLGKPVAYSCWCLVETNTIL